MFFIIYFCRDNFSSGFDFSVYVSFRRFRRVEGGVVLERFGFVVLESVVF